MREYYESSCIRDADRIASEELAIPGIVLMENAGRGAADAIVHCYPNAEKILIVCGPGNNGGDGFVVARHLSLRGLGVSVISAIDPANYRGDAKTAAVCAVSSELSITTSVSLNDDCIKKLMADADILVDALLGTGSCGEPRGEVLRLIKLCCTTAKPIVSLDIPSGIDPDTGESAESCITAELTVTFLAEKVGTAVTPAALRCGSIRVCDIGVKSSQVLKSPPHLYGFDRRDIKELIHPLEPDAHKGSRGTLMVVGGSFNYRGAPILAARAALRSGCGVVFLMIPDFAVSSASCILPEAVFIPLPTKSGELDINAINTQKDDIFKWLDNCDAVVAGPGMGRSKSSADMTELLCSRWDGALLLDADALYHLSSGVTLKDERIAARNTVITPHAGEAARLLGIDSADVSKRRLKSCEALTRYGTALLKGYHTLVCNGEERRVILEGGVSLSVPGSGDILSGVIGALLARGMSPMDAATAGALLHGATCGVTEERNCGGTLAHEIADAICLQDLGAAHKTTHGTR